MIVHRYHQISPPVSAATESLNCNGVSVESSSASRFLAWTLWLDNLTYTLTACPGYNFNTGLIYTLCQLMPSQQNSSVLLRPQHFNTFRKSQLLYIHRRQTPSPHRFLQNWTLFWTFENLNFDDLFFVVNMGQWKWKFQNITPPINHSWNFSNLSWNFLLMVLTKLYWRFWKFWVSGV